MVCFMYGLLKKKLEERKKPVSVAVVGCGWFGAGVVRELFRIRGMRVSAIISRTPARAAAVYAECGVPEKEVLAAGDSGPVPTKKRILSSDIEIIRQPKGIDVVFEATGSVLAGAQAALAAVESGKHFVTVNSEMDATIGLRLASIARENGVVYSNSDGDQPGCLARLINEASMMGFRPRVAGNCKGFMDVHQTPKGVLPFVPKGQDPVKSCSYADGSKQSVELAVVANAFGYPPRKRGMFGPVTTKQGLVSTFGGLADLKSEGPAFVDYVMGINGVDQGAGVFVVASREGERIRSDMEYMKKGKGPDYLFFRDHHLCYLEAASSIAEAALFATPTLAPKGRHAEVIAIAKRALPAGQRLDGIGGHDCYGLIERADIAAQENLLPLGLAGFATLKQDVPKDAPLAYPLVELEDNPAVRLRKEQERMPLP